MLVQEVLALSLGMRAICARCSVCFTFFAVILVLASGAVGCDRLTRDTPEPTPTLTKTPQPTFTPLDTPTQVALIATATATTAPSTPSPTVTDTPEATATETEVPEPTATDTGAPEPTATPQAQPAAPKPAAAAPSSAGSLAAKPKGSPLQYQPEFPRVSPASEPPAYDDHTNPLTGQRVDDPGRVRRRPILVRYGNDSATRPHSGISQAEVVLEDLMDAWWITRLTAVFLQEEPQRAGPVRSIRPVNIEVLAAFDGVMVYSGASIGVNQLLALHPFDLVHEGRWGDLFYRSKDRPSPHNLYTSVAAVRQRMREAGIERPVGLRGFAFRAEPPPGQPATRIDIPYPSSSTVAWTWDPGAGVYRRWVQGARYNDLGTGQQVGCENVIVLYAKHWESDIVEDSRGATAIGIALQGGERVQIFRDGRVIEGTWWRKDVHALFQFIDDQGNHIPLKPGHSWIQFVPTTYKLGISG